MRWSMVVGEAFGVRGIPALFLRPLLAIFCDNDNLRWMNLEEDSGNHPETPRLPALPPGPSVGLSTKPPSKDWQHAPVHRLSENGVYMVTAGTLYKRRLLDTGAKLDLVERLLLSMAKQNGWQLEAWAVFSNHYHFVARGHADSVNLGRFIHDFHYESACQLNAREGQPGHRVWYNFRDTRLTYQYSYLARLNYVHRNAVKHGLVAVANQYSWCSAAWFERVAPAAQVKTIYSFKTDRLNIEDDF